MARRIVTRGGSENLEERSVARTVVIGSGGAGAVYRQPWDSAKASREGARESLVAAITSAVASDLADVERFPLRVTRLGSGEDVSDRDPVAYAFNVAPNSAMSASALRAWLSLDLCYRGEAYLVMVGTTITPLIGGSVEILAAGPGSRNADGSPALIAGYVIRDDRGKELGRYDAEGKAVSGMAEGTLIRVHIPFPGDPFRAAPPIEAAGLPIDVVFYSKLASKAAMQNSGQPAGLVQLLDPAVGQDEIDSFDRRINSRLSDVSQRGRTLVVSSDVKYTQLGDNSGAGMWSELSRQARDDVMSVWTMPESRLGRGGNRTYENQGVELAAYLRGTVLPRLNLVAAALNKVLRPMGLVASFDASDVPELREDNSATVTQAVSLYQAGIATLNEARAAAGLEPLPDGDRLMEVPNSGAGAVTPRDASPFGRRSAPTQPSAAAYNAAFDAVAEDAYRRVARVAQAHHVSVYRAIVARYRRASDALELRADEPAPQLDPETLFDVAAADARLADDLGPVIDGALRGAASMVERQLAVEGLSGLPLWERVATERLERLVDGRAADGTPVWQGWNRALREDIAAAVREGYGAGESSASIAKRVQEVLGVDPAAPSRIGARAEAIARTEAGGIANEGTLHAMKASGVVTGKAWYSVGDNRTRASHKEVAATHGMSNPIPLDARFDVGGTLMTGPHDPTAPAGQVVQCRCRLLPVVGG